MEERSSYFEAGDGWDTGFAVVPNMVLFKKDLSVTAKVLYFIYSNTRGFIPNKSLMKQCGVGVGLKRLRAARKELVDAELITMEVIDNKTIIQMVEIMKLNAAFEKGE